MHKFPDSQWIFLILIAAFFSSSTQADLLLNQATIKHSLDGFEMTVPMTERAEINSFTLEDPPRFAVDITGAQHANPKTGLSWSSPVLRAVRYGVDNELKHLRIVFDLYEAATDFSANVISDSNNQYQLLVRASGLKPRTRVYLPQATFKNLNDGFQMKLPLGDPAEIHSFSLDKPHRFAVDIMGAQDTDPETGILWRSPALHTVRYGVDDELTHLRIVFDLFEPPTQSSSKVKTDIDGNHHLEVSVTGLNVSTENKPAVQKQAQPQTQPQTDIESDQIAEQTTQEAILPVFIEGEASGDLYAVLDPDEAEWQLETAGILHILKPVLQPQSFDQLKQVLGDRKLVNTSDLSNKGVYVKYSEDEVATHITINPEIRRTRVYNLYSRQQQEPEYSNVRKPASYSGAMDVFIADSWQQNQRFPSSAELDGYINLHDWVLLDRHGYIENRDREWQRRGTQLIKDLPQNKLRLSAGDVNYSFSGLMSNRPLSGVSVTTSFDLQPYRVSYPVSEGEFYLEQNSRIEIHIDQQLRSSTNLPAGRHSVYDLPLVNGISEVRLDIIDDFGRRQSLRFFEVQDQRLLKPELIEYGITTGVGRDTATDGLDYEQDNLALTAFFRRGMNSRLTAGGHIEADETITMAGITSIFASTYGTIDLDLAASRDQSSDNVAASAALLNYSYKTRSLSFSTNYTWQDENFATLGQAAATDNLHYSARMGLILPAIAGWNNSMSISENERWSGIKNSSQRLSLSRDFKNNWRVSVGLTHKNNDTDGKDTDISMQWYWSPKGKRYNANFGYNSEDKLSNAEFSYRREGELGLSARTTVSHSYVIQQQHVDLNYVAPLLESRVSSTFSETSGNPDQEVHSISFGSALAFADGAWSVSRPLKRQPFAILSGKASLGDGKVGVIRGTGNKPFTYLKGADNVAVLPNLSPHYINDIGLDSSELPLGVQMDTHQYRLKPTFFSGTRIDVGVEGKVYLVAQLVDALQQPVVYQLVSIQSVDRPTSAPQIVFTDDAGHFEVANLVAGNYILRINGLTGYQAYINIPAASFGRIESGTIKLQVIN